jgi:hypothetical protein
LKSWSELTGEERMLAERLPAERLPTSAQLPLSERMKHRFCTRCWFETKDEATLA